MNQLVLIDSSAWVETIRQKNVPETAAKVQILLATGLAAMTEPVWMERAFGIDERALCLAGV